MVLPSMEDLRNHHRPIQPHEAVCEVTAGPSCRKAPDMHDGRCIWGTGPLRGFRRSFRGAHCLGPGDLGCSVLRRHLVSGACAVVHSGLTVPPACGEPGGLPLFSCPQGPVPAACAGCPWVAGLQAARSFYPYAGACAGVLPAAYAGGESREQFGTPRCPRAVRQCLIGVALPTALGLLGTLLQELHRPLPQGSEAVHGKTSTAHCP